MTIILITFIITYVIDVVGFIPNLFAQILSFIFKKQITPDKIKLPYILQCSLCCTTWSVLLYLLITHPISFNLIILYIAVSLVAGYSTTYITILINLINKFLINFFCRLEKLITKI